ncbi:MAG: hypothetical protein AABY54_04150 [Deltaproteobacteria bacterium]
MDSAVHFLSHGYAEREEKIETAIEAGSTSLQDVVVLLSVNLASALFGIVFGFVITAIARS